MTLKGLNVLRSNSTARKATETVIRNDNILYTPSLYNCKLTAKLLGLKEDREDEVIESICQPL